MKIWRFDKQKMINGLILSGDGVLCSEPLAEKGFIAAAFLAVTKRLFYKSRLHSYVQKRKNTKISKRKNMTYEDFFIPSTFNHSTLLRNWVPYGWF